MTVLENAEAVLPETRRLSVAAWGWSVGAAAAWFAAGAATLCFPDIIDNPYTQLFGIALVALGFASLAAQRLGKSLASRGRSMARGPRHLLRPVGDPFGQDRLVAAAVLPTAARLGRGLRR